MDIPPDIEPTGAEPRRLVVVGGGIAGLAAAWEATHDPGVSVTVLEASERLGGKIRTSALDMGDDTTLLVDEGADAFLARVPDAVELCRELGLTEELTQPAAGRAKVLVDGELHFMPTDTVLGVPMDAEEAAGTGILSWDGAAAVVAERTAGPADPPGEDVAIGQYLSAQFGAELVDRLVGPLIGGINAGDVDELSLRAVTPQLADAADDAAAQGISLSEALRRRRVAVPTDAPVFHGLLDGTGRMVDALVEQLDERGVLLRTGAPVERIERDTSGQLTLHLDGGGSIEADGVVLAVPAPPAAGLLAELSPDAAAELTAISHSSVVLVTLVYDRSDVAVELDASGFLVPRGAGRFVTAASFGSTKWAHWDDGRHVVLRVSAGHAHDERPMGMTDDEVVDAVRAELDPLLGIAGEPVTARVSRYPDGFAQYTVGHLDRVAHIEAALARDVPQLRVAGAAYRGVGIPACIRQGREATRALLA